MTEHATTEIEPILVGTQDAAKLCNMGRGAFAEMVHESFSTNDPVPWVPHGRTRRLYPLRELRDWFARRAERAVKAQRKTQATVRLAVDSKR